jgi:hypothetical protein
VNQPAQQPNAQPNAQPVVQPVRVGAAQPVPQGVPQPVGPGRGTGRGQGVAAAQPVAATAGQARPVLVKTERRADEVDTHDPADLPPEDITELAIKNAPPWLVSAAFHMVLLIILGLIMVVRNVGGQIELVSEPDIWAEELGEQLEIDSPLGLEDVDLIEDPMMTPDDLPEVPDPFAAPAPWEVQPEGTTATSDIEAQIGYALDGRQEGSRNTMLGKYGGTKRTEDAVQGGLAWLARNQVPDGSWSLTGPYSNGVNAMDENRAAATAMALLAFQGAGNTHKTGKWKANVARGWAWLIEQQLGTGSFFREGQFNHAFYTDGQCTIALCELLGMSKDEKYREPAERAVQYLLKSQSPQGGWRYSPNSDSDVSVTGWIVMALQSARMAGLEVPQSAFDEVMRYLDSIASHGGARYPYQAGRESTLTMTAEAILCRQYIGWPRDDPRMISALDWVTEAPNLVSYGANQNVYYWYYATQACHHMEGKHWKRWNEVMREAVPRAQVQRGREVGSWDPSTTDPFEVRAGRLYTTCLSIYMLQVYYRHLPIYSKVYTQLRKDGRNPGFSPD